MSLFKPLMNRWADAEIRRFQAAVRDQQEGLVAGAKFECALLIIGGLALCCAAAIVLLD
ncbi:hypothetical protein AWB78_08317 [Caballeronia calidae]|uniref:Uncharacterized protein n=1 Tax=Caballeronia calidae TaxID=1777139 RepID=A0A158ELW6_9BURK|nr:hypothetical protein AWB78_08317 [Caballeronia calidae]